MSDLMDEQIRREMRALSDKILADLTSSLFLGDTMNPGETTTCAPLSSSGNLTADKLLETVNAFRQRPVNPLGSMKRPMIMDSSHLTVSKERWTRARRSWRVRLYGGRLPRWSAAGMLVVLLLAASVSLWLALALPALSLRPRRWRVAIGPRKICEQVPGPSFYLIGGAIIAHPAVATDLRVAYESQSVLRTFSTVL